ncbi:MAG TPA: hypothetical protein VFF28_03370 [Candidatus Nanoarchaeia archaeon]|nr:hypothetical protein [Candidatus Nanoarchaeia archaeon]
MEKLARRMKKGLLDFLNVSLSPFSSIAIASGVEADIKGLAKKMHPQQFFALLRGHVKNSKLVIDGLYYQPFDPLAKTAYITFEPPYMPDMVGSVHSHPTPEPKLSQADLGFFGKKGGIHLIISYPYDSIDRYGSKGEKL